MSIGVPIHCKRCESSVPWGPFCPRCGAYLEFAGDPPWEPEIREITSVEGSSPAASVEESESVTEEILVSAVLEEPVRQEEYAHLYRKETTQAEGRVASLTGPGTGVSPDPQGSARSTGVGIVVVVGVLAIGVIGGLGLTFVTNAWIGGAFALVCLAWGLVLLPRKTPAPEKHAGSESGPGLAVVIGIVVLGVAGAIGLALLTNNWIGATFALVCVAWAFALWPRSRPEPEVVPSPGPLPAGHGVPDEDTGEVVEIVAIETVEAEPLPGVEARAPQYVPTRVVEVPVVTPSQGPRGDVPCPECGDLNFFGRHYCQFCGSVMAEVLVAPATQAHQDTGEDSSGVSDSSRRAPRISRSWRGPIVAGTLAFVFLSAVVLSVFGPFAFQFRLGTTQLFQAINTFIDPFAGNQPNMTYATATSSLPGTSPDQIMGDDASTFWASQPSFIFGAGNGVTIYFDDPYTIDRVVILPGIQNGLFDVRALATPASVTMTFDDGSSITRELDSVDSQNDFRQLIEIPRTTTATVELRFDSVYPPRKGSEELVGSLAVTGVYFIEPPAPPGILTVPTEIRQNPALPGTTN